MKILQITPTNVSPTRNQAINQQNNLSCCYPNFKGANEAAKPLIEPDTLQKIIAMATTAASAAAAAVVSAFFETKETNSPAVSSTSVEADNTEIIRKLTEQNKKYEELIEQLNSRIKVLEEDKQQTERQQNQDITQKSNEMKFVFPKRRGRLSKAQEELKHQMEQLSLSKDVNSKAEEICQNILNKKVLVVSEKETDSNTFASEFAARLSNAKTKEEKEAIIEKTYNLLFIVNDTAQNDTPTAQKSEVPPSDTTAQVGQTETPNGLRRKRPRIQVSASGAEDNTTLKQKGKNKGIYSYIRSGTPSPKLVDNLTHILKVFERTKISELKTSDSDLPEKDIQKRLRWRAERTVGNITDTIVLQEAERIKEEYSKNHLPDENIHNIKFINRNNAVEVAEAINSDKRFSELFTVHAAMRFVDRFVNFDSDVPVSEQCSYALDKFEKIVKIAVKEGVDVQTYMPNGKIPKYLSPRIIISPEHYDKEALKIFGTTPLIIGICENQPDPNYYNKQFKQAVIQTIFAI